MLYLNLDTRDLEFDKLKNLVISDKVQEIKQRLVLKIELDRGEWFLNDTGIPWSGQDGIMQQTGEDQINLAKYWITEVLKNDKAVENIEYLDIKQEKENLLIDFKVICTDENEITVQITKGGIYG